MPKSLAEMLAQVNGPIIRSGLATESSPAHARPGVQIGAPNSDVLGALTGAPPQTEIRTAQVIPYTSTGAGGGSNPRTEPTLVALAVRANRVVIFTAPAVGFTIYVGPSSVSPGRGMALPPVIPYEFVLPGGQDLYAVTDAPVYLPLQVQIAPILIGDRERRP